jgi:antitoxin (DNA-binding transcriptional repressor) of toxin-antitoxin stability system
MSNSNSTTTPAPTAVTSSVLSKSLGEHLDRVLRGEQFAVTRNDRPLAALVDFSWFQGKSAPEGRLTPTMRSAENGLPIDRTEYAEFVRAVWQQPGTSEEPVTVRRGTVEAAALMLDELAGTYAGEDFGRLARQLAVVLFDVAGV